MRGWADAVLVDKEDLPGSLVVDKAGNLLVADTTHGRVLEFDSPLQLGGLSRGVVLPWRAYAVRPSVPEIEPHDSFVNCVSGGERRWTYRSQCD